jgi:hypothetical protein
MKRGFKLAIIIFVILLVLAGGFYFYRVYNKLKDYQWCLTDSDCYVKLSSCSCSNICGNNYYDKGPKCARACMENEINKTIQHCQCYKNKCIQGFLKD